MISKHGPFQCHDSTFDNDGVLRKKLPLKILENGDMYEGEWNEATNQRDGKGTCIFPTGSLNEGYWRNDKLNGNCRVIFDYECIDGNANGYGKKIYHDGSQYEGNWKGNEYHGKGKET
jgi:hypothetical protein